MSGGGTGGHIYPAIAIANQIKKEFKEAQILFVGTERGLENEIVPANGYDIKTITVSGFNRKKLMKNFGTMLKAMKGLREAREIIKEFKPDIVIGTGGYVCGPVVFTASIMGIKTFIHEQNALPGVTNKILCKFADVTFISFEESEKYFNKAKRVVLSGNPLREEFIEYTEAIKSQQSGSFKVICFGGSRGAEKINASMLKVLEVLNGIDDIELYFVTGKAHYHSVMREIENKRIQLKDNIHVLDYIHNMSEYMSASDLVISRAGALTIAEVNALGKPAILIPSPYVTGNHQYFNAKVVADCGAAYIIEERELSEEKIMSIIFKLKNSQAILKEMGENSKKLAHLDAADIILRHIKQICNRFPD